MEKQNKQKYTIRKALPADEIGRAELFKIGLKRKNFLYTGSNKPWDKKKIAKRKKDSIIFVAINPKDNKVIGTTMGFYKATGRTRHRIDCGWMVHPDYQGKGIGSELLKTLLKYAKKKGFKRAEAECAIKNIASWKLAKKLGFKIEGTKKAGLLTDDGRYINTYMVGKILK